MKTKSKSTTYERAIQTIDGFSQVFNIVRQKTAIEGRSDSTFYNYIHRIAVASLHFNKLPEAITDAELTEYLASLALDASSPSRSGFKHTVYGLRYYFRCVGLDTRAIDLPSLKKAFKLPVVLNYKELRQLFNAPVLLKHRILLMLAYSGGLRAQELCNLKLYDIDFERKIIHIRQGKGQKDRIVPLADYMAKGLQNLLGHAEIATTMIYLHIAQCPLVQAHSPIDTLYPKNEWQDEPTTK